MRKITGIAVVCALVPALLCGCLTSSAGSRKGKDESRENAPVATDEYPDYRVVVGYMPSWSGALADVDMSRLTHVNYAFHVTTEEGGVIPSWWRGAPSNYTDFDVRLDSLVLLGHKEGIKVLLAIGGASDKNFGKFVTDKKKRAHFFDQVDSLVVKYKLDGIDIDWEYPENDEEGEAFTALMKGLRARLDARDTNLLLTAAVGASVYGASYVTLEGVKQCDWINVMTYDFTGGWTSSTIGSTAPMSFVQSGTRYWHERGVSYARMAIGVPFYGVRFTLVDKNRVGAAQVAFRNVAGIFDVDRSLKADSVRFLADTARVAPGDTTRDGRPYVPSDTTWLYYWDSPDFVAEKAEYAMYNKFRGLMIWELSQDLRVDSLSLLKSMWDKILDMGKGPELARKTVTEGVPYTASLKDLRASLR